MTWTLVVAILFASPDSTGRVAHLTMFENFQAKQECEEYGRLFTDRHPTLKTLCLPNNNK